MLVPPPQPDGRLERVDNVVVVSTPTGPVAVDRSALTSRKAELDKKLTEAAAAVSAAEMKMHAQELVEKEAAAKREQERLALRAVKDQLSQDAIAVQQELQFIESMELLAEQEADALERGRNAEIPEARFAREVHEWFEPMVHKTAVGLAKLRSLLSLHESALTRISNLRAPAMGDENARVSYINTSIAAGKMLAELRSDIVAHEQLLVQVANFKPVHTANGREAIAGFERRLEEMSGMVIAQPAIWRGNGNSRVQPPLTSAAVNDAPTTPRVISWTERLASFMQQFAEIAKQAPRPEIVITLKPREDKRPRREVIEELRGPKVEPFQKANPETGEEGQTRAAGVPKE